MDSELLGRIQYILTHCRQLVRSTLEEDFPVSGNIGIFAQSEQEYSHFKQIVTDLIKDSPNPNQKYFELKEPFLLNDNDFPAKFTHIYIRKYDSSDYGKYKGDIDFITSNDRYQELKSAVMANQYPNAAMYDRPGWDTIQVTQADVDVVAYLSTLQMAEKVRVKFDSLTQL